MKNIIKALIVGLLAIAFVGCQSPVGGGTDLKKVAVVVGKNTLSSSVARSVFKDANERSYTVASTVVYEEYDNSKTPQGALNPWASKPAQAAAIPTRDQPATATFTDYGPHFKVDLLGAALRTEAGSPVSFNGLNAAPIDFVINTTPLQSAPASAYDTETFNVLEINMSARNDVAVTVEANTHQLAGITGLGSDGALLNDQGTPINRLYIYIGKNLTIAEAARDRALQNLTVTGNNTIKTLCVAYSGLSIPMKDGLIVGLDLDTNKIFDASGNLVQGWWDHFVITHN